MKAKLNVNMEVRHQPGGLRLYRGFVEIHHPGGLWVIELKTPWVQSEAHARSALISAAAIIRGTKANVMKEILGALKNTHARHQPTGLRCEKCEGLGGVPTETGYAVCDICKGTGYA